MVGRFDVDIFGNYAGSSVYGNIKEGDVCVGVFPCEFNWLFSV